MTILVFGGATGIGAALTRMLRRQGRAVHAVSRNAEHLDAIAAETGASVSVVDVMDPASVRQAVEMVGSGLTGLAYCVGSINLKPLQRIEPADVLKDLQLNALGAALALKHAAPALKANKGAVVLFSTVAVAQGFASHTSVAMAKGAVEGLALSAAAELAPHVRVNCIAPSLTRTPLAASITGSAMADAIAQLHPLQRLGEADDSAALAAFLLSDQAGWITGQVIGVDGGRSMLRTKG